jgi:aminopeptidase N
LGYQASKEWKGASCSMIIEIVCLGRLGDPAHGSSAACNIITVWLGGAFEKQHRWLVAHEVAHQYFGSLIGLSRKSLGWAPMGLGLMMDEHYMKDRGLDSNWGRWLVRDYYLRAERMGFDTTLAQSVEKPLLSPPPWSFGWNMSLTHGKAYAVCSLLRDLLGEKQFQAVVRKIIAERAGTLIDGADLIAYCQAAWEKPLDWFAADWIDGRATLDYAISSVQPTDGGWQVEVSRVGTARFPVVVQLETVDGQKLRQRADWQKATDRLLFRISKEFKTVTIDPDNCYPDMEPSNNSWPPKPTPAEKKR